MTRRSLFLLALVAWSNNPPANEPKPTDGAPPPRPATASAAVPASAPAPAKRASKCHAPPPGSTSDDLRPSLHGASGSVELLPWLDARGVGSDAALRWLVSHYGPGLTKDHAGAAFGASTCGSLKVGDAGEDALLCHHEVPYGIMQGHALIVTVRAKRPVAVLDVGLTMNAMDWLDARWLDLALAVAPDGKSAVLDDRAPDGTMLVEPESYCREREKHDEEIQAPPTSMYPAKLHDCKGGREGFLVMQRDLAKASSDQKKEARESLAFLDRACAQRGKWVWQKDRFVRER